MVRSEEQDRDGNAVVGYLQLHVSIRKGAEEKSLDTPEPWCGPVQLLKPAADCQALSDIHRCN